MNPVQKLITVNQAVGITDITQNQATTRTVWDTPETLNPTQQITFFKNSNVRQLPATNLTRNRLEVDGNLIVQKIILLAFNEGNLGTNSFFTTVDTRSLFNLKVGNDVVIKDLPLAAFGNGNMPNYMGVNSDSFYGIFIPINSIVIPPQVEFEATITCVNPTDENTLAVRCILQGFGTQFSNANY